MHSFTLTPGSAANTVTIPIVSAGVLAGKGQCAQAVPKDGSNEGQVDNSGPSRVKGKEAP